MELEDIKQQWETLNRKLNEQQIISKRLMENTVSQKIDFINAYNWIGIFIILILTSVVALLGAEKQIPSKFITSIIIILLIALVSGIYHALLLNKTKSFKNNIFKSETEVIKYQKFSYWYYMIAIVIVFIFLIFSYFSFKEILIKYHRMDTFIIICLVAIVLSIVEMRWYVGKIQKLRQSISDLKEFEKE